MGMPVGPGSDFLFGTDQLGRDVLVRLAYGARVSLARRRRRLARGGGDRRHRRHRRRLLRRLGRHRAQPGHGPGHERAVPALRLRAGLGARPEPARSASASSSSSAGRTMGRVIRGQVISLRQREFVEASRSLGAGPLSIMVVDILPNLSVPIIVYTTMMIPSSIVFEATLSFLGMGIVPPTPSWGGMLADASTNSIYLVAWWLVVDPRHGAAPHHAGLQHPGRRPARRARSQEQRAARGRQRGRGRQAMIRFLAGRRACSARWCPARAQRCSSSSCSSSRRATRPA